MAQRSFGGCSSGVQRVFCGLLGCRTMSLTSLCSFPRQISLTQLLLVMGFFVLGLGHIFYQKGGKIQQIVLDKQSTKYVRSATLIDLVYAFLLLYFKQLNNIPMSTTWVFVGLLCGRELALNTGLTKKGNLKSIFPIVAKDFLKLIVGLLVSVAIVLAIHYGTDSAGMDGEPNASGAESSMESGVACRGRVDGSCQHQKRHQRTKHRGC